MEAFAGHSMDKISVTNGNELSHFFSTLNMDNTMEEILHALRVSHTIPELEKRFRQAASTVKTLEEELALPERKAFNQARESVLVASKPEAYFHLSVKEGREIALAALERYDALPEYDDFLPQEVLTHLANAVPGSLKGLTHLLLERRLAFAQQQLFRDADADPILALLESATSAYYSREDLLNALVWIGDESVQSCFYHWRSEPPAWHTELIYPLDHYPTNGSWELNVQGTRRNLYYPINYDLVPAETVAVDRLPGPVRVIVPHEGSCGWCGRALLTLFEIDVQDLRMSFLDLAGEQLRIAMCANCSLQGQHIFTDVDGYGTSRWSRLNGERPDYLSFFDEEDIGVNSFPQRQVVLGAIRPTPYISHGSYLGGCPEWAQYSEYPRCPGCQRAMMFIGQYEPYHVDYVEGIIYAFLCTECGLATTSYQQT